MSRGYASQGELLGSNIPGASIQAKAYILNKKFTITNSGIIGENIK
jgi:hypothetical protein